ncbi:MAG: hypothetical protein ABSA94_03775 [Acidobacteriaceae bacterium]|jgi:hypothetical protein
MEAGAIFVAIFAGILVAIFLSFLPLILGEQWKAAQDRAHARRMVDAKMNARLLRLNL